MFHCGKYTPNKGASRRFKGFTLVDAMVATAISTVVLLALLATTFTTYKINHKARLRDNARSVLRTYVDQFQRLSYSDDTSGVNQVREIFIPTTTSNGTISIPTGSGLKWGELSNGLPDPNLPTECPVEIGPPGSPVTGYVTRDVRWINPATGNVTASKISDAAGFMLKGTFTITYSLPGTSGAPIRQSVTTLRLVP
jgi:type II secretory pathway pseudopilin PulG